MRHARELRRQLGLVGRAGHFAADAAEVVVCLHASNSKYAGSLARGSARIYVVADGAFAAVVDIA